MFLTEKKAAKKTCPFIAYVANEKAVTVENRSPVYASSHCLGSGCMAWQWAAVVERLASTSVQQRHDVGYCGIAGKPVMKPPFESDPSVKP